jgi:hypothetical protein
MWIIPKSITCRFAPGTEALTSDCGDASRACGQSLMLRSKPSRASSFSRGWKAGNLMRLRSGLISSNSLGESFADWWTSSLAATRASHSQPLESDSEEKTRDTSGRLSQAAFDFFSLESASLRTLTGTLPKGSITSCLTWEDWVIEQRGEFSARLSAARLISGSESLSWPTATTTEAKSDTRQDRAARGKQVMLCHAVRQWPTPTANEDKDQNASWETLAKLDKGGRILRRIATLATGPAAPASRSSDGSRQESWATPSCMDTLPARSAQALTRAKEKGGCKNLREEVVQWATPEAKNQVGYQVGTDGTKWPRLGSQVSGKLNPRWVETLMGLPVGWTMPSCPSPVTIAPMSCVSSETESCQQLPSLPS